MLYVSTLNKTDSFTAHRVLHGDKAPEGGLFAPFHLPVYNAEEIEGLKELSFSETVAKILNLFFSRRINSWDVEFSIGRYPFKLETIGQRVIVAELWHNNLSDYDYIVSSLYRKLTDKPCETVPQWVCVAVEIAVLFGLYGELLRSGISNVDIALTDDVLYYPVAAWYARKMGLPVGFILCGCKENSGLWELMRRGEASASVSEHIQWLIFENFGADEAVKFATARKSGQIYRLRNDETGILNQGIYPSVIGSDRIISVATNIQRTCGYTADPVTAASYGAVQDYRAETGENRATLLLSRQKPKE